jgi:hypothetical protein
MTAPVVTMSKQKKQIVPVAPASPATMLPTLWAGRGYADFDDFCWVTSCGGKQTRLRE